MTGHTHFITALVLLLSQENLSLAENVTQSGSTTATIPTRSNSSMQRALIPSGSNAPLGLRPWQISLAHWNGNGFVQFCGATLLNENWAITAAHCVYPFSKEALQVGLGFTNFNFNVPSGYQVRYLQYKIIHKDYDDNDKTLENDLALLKFDAPVKLLPSVYPVHLPDKNENFVGKIAFVTGWGRLYEGGPSSPILQQAAVPVITNRQCELMYRKAGHPKRIPHTFICAGYTNGGPDACQGDSGGPMVIQRSDGRFVLVGITSWGIGCGKPNQPGVYTRVSVYRRWIEAQIRHYKA